MAHLQDTYKTNKGNNNLSYAFTSIGIKGKVEKVVTFEPIEKDSVIYNLAFGDFINGEMNDLIVTNNGDTWKVLATIATIVLIFFEKNSEKILFAQGSTPARTRLYKMGISKYYNSISSKYVILGLAEGNWQSFQSGVVYEAFMMYKK